MGVNIVGGMSDEHAQAEMMVGLAEEGAMPYDAMVGAVMPLLPRLGVQQQTALGSRIMALRPGSPAIQALHANPSLAALTTALRTATQPGVQAQPPASAMQLREVVQGLDSVIALAPGNSLTLTFNATMTFRPSRLMVGPAFAPLFVIEDLKVAADSLFLSPGAVPAEVFLPNAVTASAIKRRTAAAGTPLFVTFTNVDIASHRFRGALFGEALDQGSC